MQTVSRTIQKNLASVFVLVGLVWLSMAALANSALVGWPVVAFLLSGLLLRTYPDSRLTSPWASSSAVMGLILSAYQAYEAAPLVTGAFAFVAGSSMAIFIVFGVFHVFLIFASRPSKQVK